MNERAQSVVVIGGGPGGYEAALVAAALGATVTVVDADGLGGSCVLTDCVPSKALISTAAYVGRVGEAEQMGVHLDATHRTEADHNDAILDADIATVNRRILTLAGKQSSDVEASLTARGVTVVRGTGRLVAPDRVEVTPVGAPAYELRADMILLATGAAPRVMDTAVPDGERILTWQQVWSLTQLPEHLIVVGSGVTGAELAQAYLDMGTQVTLVSSRDRVLPGEDPDAAQVIEDVFRDRGMTVLNRSRMAAVRRTGGAPGEQDGVVVTLEDGREITGSHALLAVGSVPRTEGLGLAEVGVELTSRGYIAVDKVSRTSVRGIYAAGDCTGVLPLASVAATQGRIAVAHALGDAVAPLNIHGVSSNIFTDPEIATVGLSQEQVDQESGVLSVMMPLATNARAKMDNLDVGFVKLFARAGSHTLVGGVVVAPRASELIFPIALAVGQRLTVEQVASTITVYPSLTGSIAEAARRLHAVVD